MHAARQRRNVGTATCTSLPMPFSLASAALPYRERTFEARVPWLTLGVRTCALSERHWGFTPRTPESFSQLRALTLQDQVRREVRHLGVTAPDVVAQRPIGQVCLEVGRAAVIPQDVARLRPIQVADHFLEIR